MKKVGDIALIVSGYAFDSKLFNNDRKGVPLIRIRDVGKSSSETFYSGSFKEAYLVENGDFLIGMDGEFRLAEWKGEKALLNQRVCKVDPIVAKVWKRYLLYALPKELKRIEDVTPFVTVKHLSVKQIKDIQIPLPPLETQKKIAEILDTADTLRQKDKALIEKYNQLTQSLFLEMFGDPVRNEKGFCEGTIRDLVSEVKYGTSAKSEEGGAFPYLRMNNISYDGYINLESLKYINLPDADKPKYLVKKGDVLFNRTNSKELVGKTGIWNSDDIAAIAGYLIRVRVNDKANPYFIWGYLNSKHGKKTLENMCKNIVGMANINAQELQNIRIHLPPIDLQSKFASMVEEIEKQKQLAEENLKKSETLFNSLLQRAFKGELV